jgi:hypothetical protein
MPPAQATTVQLVAMVPPRPVMEVPVRPAMEKPFQLDMKALVRLATVVPGLPGPEVPRWLAMELLRLARRLAMVAWQPMALRVLVRSVAEP